jgi:hypothetical protein
MREGIMVDFPSRIEGGCLCGAVRFGTNAPPVSGAFCHCRMCQKSYGGLFQAVLQFRAEGFSYERGEPKYYSSSALVRRGFCAECGAPLLFAYEGSTDLWIPIGALDHPDDWPMTKDATWGPTAHYHTDSRLPWHDIEDGLPQWTSETTPFQDAARKALGEPSP